MKNVSREKVIHHKMICYISSFHLNVNDWFNEYENIEIFNIQLLSKLGKYFYFHFYVIKVLTNANQLN